MTTTPRHRADDDLEAAVRAMLTRRAADIHPHRPGAGTKVISIAPLPASPATTQSRRRVHLTLAAAVTALVVGAAALLVAVGDDDPTSRAAGPPATVDSAVTVDPPPAVWPTPDSGVQPGTSPEEAAFAYLAQEAGIDDAWHLVDVTPYGDDGATVDYRVSGDPESTVVLSTRRSGDAWYVIGVNADLIDLAWVVRHPGEVLYLAVPGPGAVGDVGLSSELIGSDGSAINWTPRDGYINSGPVMLRVPRGTTPIALQVTARTPDGRVAAFASRLVGPVSPA